MPTRSPTASRNASLCGTWAACSRGAPDPPGRLRPRPRHPPRPGGPTCSCNVAPLCRHHHRLKTHTPWRYQLLEPGVYLWTVPHGYVFLRDPSGTTDVTPAGLTPIPGCPDTDRGHRPATGVATKPRTPPQAPPGGDIGTPRPGLFPDSGGFSCRMSEHRATTAPTAALLELAGAYRRRRRHYPKAHRGEDPAASCRS